MKVLKRISIMDIFIHLSLFLFSLTFIIPLLVIVSTSLMTQEAIYEHGFTVLPKMFDFSAFQYVFKNPAQIISSYKVSIITSIVSLVLYLSMSSACAYVLSKRDFPFKRSISFFLFFTMLFSGGLAPSYIMMTKYFHLQNTYWALILPLLGNVWWLFIIRTFFQQLPQSISESAEIDGANEIQIFFRIMLPLSKPVLATVGVMSLLSFWSSWMPALLYISDKNLYPLQYLLQIMLRNLQQLLRDMQHMPVMYTSQQQVPTEPVRMAMALVAAGPMLIIFPFFQKYFAQGITVGSIKG